MAAHYCRYYFLMKCTVSWKPQEHDSGAVKGKNCCRETLSNKGSIKCCCHGCDESMCEKFFGNLYYGRHCGWPLSTTNHHSDNQQIKGLRPKVFIIFCGLQLCINTVIKLHEIMLMYTLKLLFPMETSIKTMKIKIINIGIGNVQEWLIKTFLFFIESFVK